MNDQNQEDIEINQISNVKNSNNKDDNEQFNDDLNDRFEQSQDNFQQFNPLNKAQKKHQKQQQQNVVNNNQKGNFSNTTNNPQNNNSNALTRNPQEQNQQDSISVKEKSQIDQNLKKDLVNLQAGIDIEHNVNNDDMEIKIIEGIKQHQVKKSLKKISKRGEVDQKLNLQDNQPIMTNPISKNKKVKKGKNKKEREQELLIDEDGNDDEEVRIDNKEALYQSNEGIEFYNRQPPNVVYETDQDQMKSSPNQNDYDGSDVNKGNDADYEDDNQDQNPYGISSQKQKNSKKKKKSGVNLKKKVNQEYLEQLKAMNDYAQTVITKESNKSGQDNQQDEEDDPYTQEYLKQQKSRKKSANRFYATGQNGDIITDDYGLKDVKVGEVMDETRKTQRSQRTGRKTANDSVSYRGDVSDREMAKSIGKTAMNTMDNKFSIAEVEYHDPERLAALEKSFNKSNIQPQNANNLSPRNQVREISYEDKIRRLQELQQQHRHLSHNLDDSSFQVNHSYIVSNENQRILESQDDERFHKMLNQDRQMHEDDFEEVKLHQNNEAGSRQSKSAQRSGQMSVKNADDDKEQQNKFDKLHYNLSKAINEAMEGQNESYTESNVIPFQLEQFRELILSTYDDWYSDVSVKWNIDDYLQVVQISALQSNFGKYLEQNRENLMNLQNMPFLDLGDKPESYNPKKSEAEQIFIVPKSQYPDKLLIRYADCKPLYSMKRLQQKYDRSGLLRKNLSFYDIQQTIIRASLYLQPYRGYVSKLDKINLASILIGLIITIALSMSIGITKHWSFSLIFIVIYFLFAALSIKLTKRRSNKYLRQAHFMLAVYCRAENNRLFLRNNVELRPGFLAKWIEFNIINPQTVDQPADNEITNNGSNQENGTEQMLERMRERWEKQKEMKKQALLGRKTKQPSIPIKDIEQYKKDQQLAILLQQQEEESGIEAPSKLYDQNQDDIEEEKEHQNSEKFGKSNKINQKMMGINEDQIYSGLYDKEVGNKQYRKQNTSKNINEKQQFQQNQKIKKSQTYGKNKQTPQRKRNEGNEMIDEESDSYGPSSMKKLNKNYQNDPFYDDSINHDPPQIYTATVGNQVNEEEEYKIEDEDDDYLNNDRQEDLRQQRFSYQSDQRLMQNKKKKKKEEDDGIIMAQNYQMQNIDENNIDEDDDDDIL